MRAWRAQLPKVGLTDTEPAGYVDDPAILVEHQRHRVTLELVGERTTGPPRRLLHIADMVTSHST
jgi:hypothetical protein